MTTASTSTVAASLILPALNRAIGYGSSLTADIPADRFAYMPHPKMNHPAFTIGHLTIYPNRMLAMLGREDLVRPLEGWDAIFGAGVECVDDAARYPDKETLVTAFAERYGALVPVLETVPDETLWRENPIEGRFRELFPTVGVAVNFMCCAHTMMHLGQLSAWRRAIGLGPVM